MQEFSTQTDVQKTVCATNQVETSLQTLMELPDIKNAQTQTEGLTLRELQGLDKTLQRTRGELTNNLTKLTELDKDITRPKQKLQEAEDETSKRDIRSRIQNLEDERAARLEAASANKEELRGQINRIKETINKVLKEDTTLRERLKTLFKEQGITIVSILTAIGMIIDVIVEAVIPTTGGGTTTPKPPSKEGVKDWVKKQLHNLSRLLANLAGKAAAALPGFIGSIVSWLQSATGKVVNWFGNNLWALVVLVAGLLYAAAKEWIINNQGNRSDNDATQDQCCFVVFMSFSGGLGLKCGFFQQTWVLIAGSCFIFGCRDSGVMFYFFCVNSCGSDAVLGINDI